MQAIHDAFVECSKRVRHLGGLHDALCNLTTTAIDSSDLLRAQIVLTVSSLDYFIHEITVSGMLEVFQGIRPATDAFNRYKVSANLLFSNRSGSTSAFEADIRERHSFLSFQQPEKIADAIRLFHPAPIWREVALKMRKPEDSIKSELRLIVDRRNKIAHEADIDPSYPGQRWPISKSDSENCLSFVLEVCGAIYETVK